MAVARQSLPKSLLVYSGPPQATSDAPNLTARPAAPVPSVVLDTNVVLDWLVFQDPGAERIGAAVSSGSACWLVCARMRDELARTLAYPGLEKWKPDSERTLTFFDRHSHLRPDPPPAPRDLRCTDGDDQVFVDLALATGSRWLLTHDRALLRLARRAARSGLVIVKPAGWPGP